MNSAPEITELELKRRVLDRRSPKTIWHPLSLQQMKQSEFIAVVNGILTGHHELCTGTLRATSAVPEDQRKLRKI